MAGKPSVSRAVALRRLGKILGLLRVKQPRSTDSVDLSLVSTARMRSINREHRGKDAPTDVLSFPAPAVLQKQGFLGELVIALPMLRRQARECGHAELVELDVLLVHGVLHLLGFDHERGAKDALRQLKKERLLLKKLGRKAESGLIDRVERPRG